MKKNIKHNAKIFTLAGGMFFAGLLSSACNRAEKRAAAEKARQEAIADSIKRAEKTENARIRAWDEMYENTRDSIDAASGHDKIFDEYMSRYDDEHTIKKIQESRSLSGTMNAEIMKSGTQILANADTEIKKLMEKYQLNYTGNVLDTLMYGGYKYDVQGMIFVYEIDENGWENKPFKKWQDTIYAVIEESEYGDNRKLEIKKGVDAIIEKTKKTLIDNRTAVIAKYNKYIAEQKWREIPVWVSYGGEGSTYAGFDDIWPKRKYSITKKYASVYDQNLPVDFFGDKDAVYKLVSVGEYKWQVIKTNKNGKVEKSAVFSDKVKFIEEIIESDDKNTYDEYDEKIEIRVGDSWFYYTPGTNLGVHVSYSEITKIHENKDVWTPRYTANEQRIMDSLQSEITRKDPLWDVAKSLSENSEKQAEQITVRKLGARER